MEIAGLESVWARRESRTEEPSSPVAPRRRMDVADVDVVVAVGEDGIFSFSFFPFCSCR
jgi:hypothetical protein